MNIQKVVSYLTKFCKFSNLPSFEEFKEGFEPDDEKYRDSELDGLEREFEPTELYINFTSMSEKNNLASKIASHLWGGESQTLDFFKDIKITDVVEMSYADHKPLKVSVNLKGGIEKVFYAKPFDERRLAGLELVHLLSPDKYNFSASGEAIYEDEIPGIEAEEFEANYKGDPFKNESYVSELVKLDFLTQLLLLGDMHKRNYLVSSNNITGEEKYSVRPIDFDKIFLISKIEYADVLSTDKDKILKFLGKEKYDSIRETVKGEIRKRYYENKNRINTFLEIINESDKCTVYASDLRNSLSAFHNDIDIAYIDNFGELLKVHFERMLEP